MEAEDSDDDDHEDDPTVLKGTRNEEEEEEEEEEGSAAFKGARLFSSTPFSTKNPTALLHSSLNFFSRAILLSLLSLHHET